VLPGDISSVYLSTDAVAEVRRKSVYPNCLPGIGTGRIEDGQAECQKEKAGLSHFGSHLLSVHLRGIGMGKSDL